MAAVELNHRIAAIGAGAGTLSLTAVLGALGGAGVFDSAPSASAQESSKLLSGENEGNLEKQTSAVDQTPSSPTTTAHTTESQPAASREQGEKETPPEKKVATPPVTSNQPVSQVKSPPAPAEKSSPNGKVGGKVGYVYRVPSGSVMTKPNDKQLYTGSPSGSVYFGPDFDRNSKFNLGIHRCFESFFPGAWKPEMNSDVQNVPKPANFDNWKNRLLMYPPYEANAGFQRGCAIMNLSYIQHLFLFKSEVALKNDRIGMVLWSGIKSTSSLKVNFLQLHFVYHLTFLTKGPNNAWSTVASFSWGTDRGENRSTISELTFKFPNGQTHRFSHSSDVKDISKESRISYAGHWEPNMYGKVPALGLSSEPYYVEDNYNSEYYGVQKRTIDPTIINGYGAGADAFLDETLASMNQAKKDSKSWRWKKLVQSDGSLLKLDITSVVEAWYKPFRVEGSVWDKLFGWSTQPILGQWEDMSAFCGRNGKHGKDNPTHHLCYAPE